MIQKVAKTVIKTKNYLEFTNFKIAYQFSNKQDPFKKFKKPININKQNVQNKPQAIKNQETQNKNTKMESNPEQNKIKTTAHIHEHEHEHEQSCSIKTSPKGFDKFKRKPKSVQQGQKVQKASQPKEKVALNTKLKFQQTLNNKKQKPQVKLKIKNVQLDFQKFKAKPQTAEQNKLNIKQQNGESKNQNNQKLTQQQKQYKKAEKQFKEKFQKLIKMHQNTNTNNKGQLEQAQAQMNKAYMKFMKLQIAKQNKRDDLTQEQKQMFNDLSKIKFDKVDKIDIQFQKIKRPNEKQIKEKLTPQQKKKINDAFAKFKKTVKQEDKNKKQQKKINPENQKNNQKTILNQKQHSKQKEQIYQNTQKKKEEQKQQWEKFFENHIKKQKKKQGQSNWYQSTFEKFKKQAQNNKKQNDKIPPQPVLTPQSLMVRLFVVGLAAVVFFNIFSDIKGRDIAKLVQPQQMMNMVKTHPVKQTWFLKIIQSIGEQTQSRTKQYTCIQLMSGQKFKCQSNDQFQNQWNKFIDKNNQEAIIFQNKNVITKKPYVLKRDSHIFNFIRSVLGYGLLFMFISSIMNATKGAGKNIGKGGGNMSEMFGTGAKSNRFRQTVNVKFDDVVGMNKAKQQIVEFIDFLMKPDKYNKLGARIPRGALLTGPPGTGKTMLAKACAGQGNVPFFTISGSEFMEMYVGVGAQRVRSLFKQAKQSAPSIIFIDQIDAVGKKRASGPAGGGNSQRDNTLNQLLVQMDGFQTGTNVIVFAATNQKQVLDPALTRPGRFDRLIQVDLPDIEGRRQIFLVHLKPIVLNDNTSVEQYAKRLATLTPGFSGADIKNLCNQAAIIAARGDKKSVSMIDFQLASERIIGGVQKKSSLITPQTRKTVAYHQCGHGVVSWFMQHANPLLKLTIIPRSKGALGYAQYLPNQNQMYTKQQLMDQICVILGGRVAEQVFFGKISTGASDDLQKAFKVAKTIVAQYGMGKTLNWTSYSQTEYVKEYSTMIEEKIDNQILQIVGQCAIRTRTIIQDKKQLIGKLAQQLLKVQTIDQKIISSILGQRPFKNSKQYEQYIRQKNKLSDQNNPNNSPPPTTLNPQVNFRELLNEMVKVKTPSKKIQYIQSN